MRKRFKGCCLMCAAWIRGDGKRTRMQYKNLKRAGDKDTKYKTWKRNDG